MEQTPAGVHLVKVQLRYDEGLRLKPYKCSAGKITIGYGRNLEDRPLTQEEAEYLLDNDVKIAWNDARSLVLNFDKLSTKRQATLANLAYWIGRSRLAQFKKMIAAIEACRFHIAADELLDSALAAQIPSRTKRLAKILRDG